MVDVYMQEGMKGALDAIYSEVTPPSKLVRVS